MHTCSTRAMVCRYSSHPPVLTLLLLLLCCTVGCLAMRPPRCMHEEMNEQKKPVTVVREIPRKGQGAMQAYTASAPTTEEDKDKKNFEPIRIKAFTRDLNDPSKYCTRAGEERVDQTYTKVYCRADGVLTVRKKRIIEEQLIPAAIKMHTERIFVVPVKGTVLVPSLEHTHCSHYTIPEEHHTIGLQDADLYLYVAALQTDRAAAWAMYCGVLDDGRPYVGSMNMNPSYVEATDAAIRTVAHEIGHVLGFDAYMFMSLRIMGTVKNVRHREVSIINTSQSKNVAIQHYGCPNAPGIELESTTRCGAARSHLEFRNARDEMMAPASVASYYTNLTLAIFDSMPFYKVNYSMAEPMKWGNNTGCRFLEEKCLTKGESPFPDIFCNQPRREAPFLCTHDRLALGYCTITWYSTPLPFEYQYFYGKHFGGTDREMDYCPYVQPLKDSSCTKSTTIQKRGSFVGPKSRCVKGDGLKFTTQPVGDVCVNTRCEKGKLEVQFRLDEKWYECKNKGDKVSPTNGNWSGSIICPAYEEFCTEHRNVTIVLEELPARDDDDQPAPPNITWKKTIKPSSAPQPHLPQERPIEEFGKPRLERELSLTHPNIPSDSSRPHTSEEVGRHDSTTHNVPTTSVTDEKNMELADLHIHHDNAALDTREAQSGNIQSNRVGAESSPHPGRTRRELKDGNQEDSDTNNNLVTNGKGRAARALNNSDAIALNIGIGDGSVTAAGHASLLLLAIVSAVTVVFSL